MYTNRISKTTKILIATLIVVSAVVIFPREIGVIIFSVGTVIGMWAQGMDPFPPSL